MDSNVNKLTDKITLDCAQLYIFRIKSSNIYNDFRTVDMSYKIAKLSQNMCIKIIR